MAEFGGPTAQSGIYYQNSIAALYLGAMLDFRVPADRNSRVVSVRVEAPEEIDDTVVTHADRSMIYIQAKEQFALQGEAWDKFWAAARRQHAKCLNDRDQFRLVLGTVSATLESLQETLERAQGKENVLEWRNALNKRQAPIAHSILTALALPDEEAFAVVKRTRAEFTTLNFVETIGARDWMPRASELPSALLSHLRDCCGGAARIRQTFRASDLSETLLRRFNVRVFGSHSDGLEQYRQAVAVHVDHIGVPGTSLSVREDDLLVWPTIISADDTTTVDFEDEDPWLARKYAGDEVNLRDFPSPEFQTVVLESGAGHGKSTILRATVRRLAMSTTFIPALIHAEALPDHPTIQDYLNTEYNARYQVDVDWTALCEQGRAVVVIDGVDELTDGARAALINMIERSAARFPDVSLLIGARDASVTVFPPNFKLIRVQRLEREQMIAMLKAYFRTRNEFDAQMIVRHVLSYQELESLCKIPLFLAIFAATLPKDGAVPTSRAELLERYVLHALSPEKHKGVRRTSISKTQLRRGAETIASISLERNEAAIPEAKVRASLSKVLGEPMGDDCVDTLIQYGLVERRGARLAFCIPTVQEYLAGCVLAETGKLNAVDWLGNVYRRPWAQAIQYAVEKIEDADAILRQLIEGDDDLFYTSLRLAARCIVNGASVSPILRESVALRLGRVWIKGGHRTMRQIGSLIADGFFKPLHPEIRRTLMESSRYIFERSAILVRISDGTLTLECLRTILKNDDIRELWVSDWQSAMKPVMDEAIALLLSRARHESANTLSASVIAEVFYQCRDEMSIDWKTIADDETLPLVVRTAAEFALSRDSSVLQPLIESASRASKGNYLWQSFREAYLSTTWWKAHCRELFRLSPDDGRGDPLRYLDDDGAVPQDIVDFLSEIARDPLTNQRYRAQLFSLLGSLGISDFAETAVDLLAAADIGEIYDWIHNVPYFPEIPVMRGISVIFSRPLSNSEQVGVLEALSRVVNWKPVGQRSGLTSRGPFLPRREPWEAAARVVSQAEHLIKSGNLSKSAKRTLLSICANHGATWAIRQVAFDVGAFLDSDDAISHDNWSWLASAVDILVQNGLDLDTDRLWQIIDKGQTFPMYKIVTLLIAREGSKCYPALIDYVGRHPRSTAMHAVYDYFERNAPREGLKVRYIEGKLQIIKI